jgi:hypothetical protein
MDITTAGNSVAAYPQRMTISVGIDTTIDTTYTTEAEEYTTD